MVYVSHSIGALSSCLLLTPKALYTVLTVVVVQLGLWKT